MGKKRKKVGIKRFEPVFGKWYVVQKIGQVSYGSVYKIYKKEHGKKVYSALKHIHIGPNPMSLFKISFLCILFYTTMNFLFLLAVVLIIRPPNTQKAHPSRVCLLWFWRTRRAKIRLLYAVQREEILCSWRCVDMAVRALAPQLVASRLLLALAFFMGDYYVNEVAHGG